MSLDYTAATVGIVSETLGDIVDHYVFDSVQIVSDGDPVFEGEQIAAAPPVIRSQLLARGAADVDLADASQRHWFVASAPASNSVELYQRAGLHVDIQDASSMTLTGRFEDVEACVCVIRHGERFRVLS